MSLVVGIIGYGVHGEFLLDAARRIGVVDVRWIYRRNLQEARQAAANQGVSAAESYQQILEDPQVGAVLITSPSGVHREHCEAALRAGKHVLLEKPLADTDEDAIAIVEAAGRSDRIVMVDHCERFDPAFLDAREVVATGRIGEMRAITSNRLSPLHLNNPSWAMGVLDTAVHNIDLICWLMDASPLRVCARSARVNPKLDIDDNVWISLEFPDGRRAEDHIAWVEMERYMMPVAHPRFLLQGTQGFYQVDLWRRSGLLYNGECSRYTDDVLLGLSEGYLSTMAYSLWHFARAIREGRSSPMPPADAYRAARVAMAARESIQSGSRWIALK